MKLLILLFSLSYGVFASGNSGNFTITSASFDPEMFTIKLSWNYDTTGNTEPVQGGISVRLGTATSNTPDFLIYFETPLNDTTFLIPELRFDTVYTLEVWKKNQSGWIPPDTSAIKTISITSSTRQPVEFFEPGSKTDTVAILNRHIFFWNDQTYPAGLPPHTDTVISYSPAPSNTHGLVYTGAGLQFLHPEPTVPFYIGFKVDSNKIDGSLTRIFTDSLGFFRAESKSVYDSINHIIYTRTNSIRFPFVVMTDTVRPVIKVISDTASVIGSDAIIDTILIRDNCHGVQWSFFCIIGDDRDTMILHPVSNGILQDSIGFIYCRFPFLEFGRNGAKAFLAITDGTYRDTINLSRRSTRAIGDIISTEGKFTMPIFTTVDLDSSSVRSALSTLFQLSGGSFNKKVFRLYRWYPFDGNSASSSKWIEASTSNEHLFQFNTSNLYWLITKQSVLFELGSGKTPSLKNDFTITLPPKNWTDFSIPFSFGIKLSEVIEKSGPDVKNLYFYKWDKSLSSKTYSATLLYSQSVQGENYTGIAFTGKSDGYTVFNPSDTAIQLHFPPHCFSNGVQQFLLSKQAQSSLFTIAVNGTSADGTSTTIYCSAHHGNDTLKCPQPPSFSPPIISIAGPDTETQYSITSLPEKGPLNIYRINLANTHNSPVRLAAETINNALPLEYCFMEKSRTGFSFRAENSLSINPSDESIVYLAAGERTAIDAFRSAALKEQQYGEDLQFRYNRNQITFGSSKTLLQDIFIELFNLQGKRIAHFTITNVQPTFKTPLTPGVYIFKISTSMNNEITGTPRYQRISIGQQELFHGQ
jgi:hypothetical protein